MICNGTNQPNHSITVHANTHLNNPVNFNRNNQFFPEQLELNMIVDGGQRCCRYKDIFALLILIVVVSLETSYKVDKPDSNRLFVKKLLTSSLSATY